MIYTDVIHPQWANTKQSAINLVLVTDAHGELPFTATAQDSTEYGPQIFARVVAGEFGEIGAFAPPSDADVLPAAQTTLKLKMQDAGLAVAPLQDAVDLQVATQEQMARLTAWKRYRVKLSEVPRQAGWPRDMLWPVPPES